MEISQWYSAAMYYRPSRKLKSNFRIQILNQSFKIPNLSVSTSKQRSSFFSGVKADSLVSGNRIRPKQRWTICYWRLFLMTVFIMEEHQWSIINTASECIRTQAATYGCKILQLYEYDANVYGCNTNCEWHPRNTSSCSIQGSSLPGWGISASV